MKKTVYLFALAGILIAAGTARANEAKGMFWGHGSPRGEMMEHKCMEAQIAPTSDGGVIIMKGDHLYKYDKSLNLVKSVDMEKSCCDKMGEHKKCPMCEKGLKHVCPMQGVMSEGDMDKDPKKECPMMKGKMMDKDCPMMKKMMEEKDAAGTPAAPTQNFGPRK